MENPSTPRNNAFNLIPLDERRAYWCALFFHVGGQEQLKSVQHLTVDKNVLTDQKTLFLLDMLIILSSSILCVAVQVYLAFSPNTLKCFVRPTQVKQAYKVPNLILIFVRQGTRWFPA